NAPLPARIASRHQRVGCGCCSGLAVYDNCPIARQPTAPVFVPRLERLLDEQAAKAAAIHEEVGGYGLTAFEGDRLNESRLGMDRDTPHFTFGSCNPARLRKAAQVAREAGGIEVQRIGQLVQ